MSPTTTKNNNDDDAPIGPDDVVKARITLRRFRWFRTGVVVACVALLAGQVSAFVHERAAEAHVDALIAQVESWSVDLQPPLAPGTRVHNGRHGSVIETASVVVLVVDGTVVARAPHPSP